MTGILRYPDGAPADAFLFSDEALHPVQPHPNWQESLLMIWYDIDNDVGGYWRFGYDPHIGRGVMTIWGFVHTPAGAYRRVEEFPKRDGDVTPNGFGAGGIASYRFDGNATHWSLHDGDVACGLQAEPYHIPVDLYPPHKNEFGKDMGAAHFEVSSGVTGTVSMQGNAWTVKGLAYRDHSWGIRHWGVLRAHRWVNGVFGPDLSFCFLNYLGSDGAIKRTGYLIRDGVLNYTTDVQILTYMDADAATHRGGRVRARLATGEIFECESEPLCKGFYLYKAGLGLFQSPCKVRYGNRVGFGNFEISENGRSGTEPYAVILNGYDQNNVSSIGKNGDWK